MNFAAPFLLVVAASAPLATRAQHVVGGDLTDALGQAVVRDFERANEGVAAVNLDPNSILFEPQGREFRQERPEDLVRGHGFEAMYRSNDCGDHGCAKPTTVTTVVSPNGARAQTADRTTSLTRAPSASGALWTLQQAPNSCSLSWFNASWPLVSSYEVQPQAYGVESCIDSPGTVWFGMFQFEDSAAVDVLFDKICGGQVDLRWTLLGDHVERIAPRRTVSPMAVNVKQSLPSTSLLLGPTDTASQAVAARKRLDASGTVFMVVRNGCSGPVTIEVKQSLMARVDVSLANTFDLLDAVIVVLVIGASAMFVYSAVLLCQAMKTLDDLEDVLESELDEDDRIAKVSSLPSKVLVERTSSADEPLLKKLQM